MKLFLVFLAIIVYKLISNTYYYFKMKKLYDIYADFFLEESKLNVDHYEYGNIIKQTILRSGVKDGYIAVTRPLGFGQIANHNVSILDNCFSNETSIFYNVNIKFRDALGIFKSRIFESFNPIYWIETLIFLPKNMFKYLNVEDSKLLVRFSQIIYWIITATYAIFSDELNTYLKDFLSSLFR